MPRKKLIRYKDLNNFENVYDGLNFNKAKIFKNSNPKILELACGRGEYTNGLAGLFPDQNFVGIDIKGERIWQAARKSKELNLTNTAFIRGSIDLIQNYFEPGSLSSIWIIHPDPQPKRERQRLTHPKYLAKYNKLMKHKSLIHLKTDDQDLYKYTLETFPKHFEIIKKTNDLYNSDYLEDHHNIQTNFEQKAISKNKTITYIQAIRKES